MATAPALVPTIIPYRRTTLPGMKETAMSTSTPTEPERASFAEEALRLGGKSEEEVRRMGAMDKADEQVETMFARNHQTTASQNCRRSISRANRRPLAKSSRTSRHCQPT